eukprot:tig00020830_g14442.t1
MGKADFLTPKAISNRIKAKGLQKLRWYCQMCQKQCRDENGFKCHCESESHQRQMQIFAEQPNKIVDTYSEEFMSTYVGIISRQYCKTRVHANVVYNQVVADRHHIHMNATKWKTLTNFVLHLGKEGIAKVEDTPKGWYVEYIDRDPEKMRKQKELENRERADMDAEEARRRMIEKQIEVARALEANKPESVPTELVRDESQKITLSLFGKGKGKAEAAPAASPEQAGAGGGEGEGEGGGEEGNEGEEEGGDGGGEGASGGEGPSAERAKRPRPSSSSSPAPRPAASASAPAGSSSSSSASSAKPTPMPPPPPPPKVAAVFAVDGGKSGGDGDKKRKLSAMEEIRLAEEERKKRDAERAKREALQKAGGRFDYWLYPSIVVKVMNKELKEGKYYKQKGVVEKVHDKYIAEIKMQETGHRLKLDQSQLETVIPNVGGRVLFVNGFNVGETGVVESIEVEQFCAKVKLETGRDKDRVVRAEYEDICRLA